MKKITMLLFAVAALTAIQAQTKADTTFTKVVTIAQSVSPNVHVDTLNNISDLISAVKELKEQAPDKASSVEQIIAFSFLVLGLLLGIVQFLLHHNLKQEFLALKDTIKK